METEKATTITPTPHGLYLKGFYGVLFYIQISQFDNAASLLQESMVAFLCEEFELDSTNTEVRQQIKLVLLGQECNVAVLPHYFGESFITESFAELFVAVENTKQTENGFVCSQTDIELLYNRVVEKIKQIDSSTALSFTGNVNELYQYGMSKAQAQIARFEQKHNCSYEAYDVKVYSKPTHTWEEEQEINDWLMAQSDYEHYHKLLTQ